MAKLRFCILFLCIWLSSIITAATVTYAHVDRKGKAFYMDSILEINAPREDMFELLTDYDRMKYFSSGFVDSKKYPVDENGEVKVYMHIRGCVSFFCRHIKKMEKLEVEGKEKITTTLIPEESHNLKAIDSSWELSDVQIPSLDGVVYPVNFEFAEQVKDKVTYSQGTKIRYRMKFHPDFWVPPLIGGYLVKKSMVADGTDILNRMEKYAQEHMQN